MIIIIISGSQFKPNLSPNMLFEENAITIKNYALAIAEVAPEACVGIITYPVNALVPLFAKVMESRGKLSPNKIFGITTLDVVRSNTFFAELKGLNPMDVKVPCIGGHDGATIIPLISQASPKTDYPPDVIQKLITKIQNAGRTVIEAKEESELATLSKAYAGARFTLSLIRGLNGEPNITECSYVLSAITRSKYFATPLLLGKNGVEKNLGLAKGITKFEHDLINKAIPLIQESIEKGEKFASV